VSGEQAALGQDFFGDLDGIPAPPIGVDTWRDVESFDAGTWSASGGTAFVEPLRFIEGDHSIRIRPTPESPTNAMNSENLGDWSGTNCAVTRHTDEGHLEGFFSIKGVGDGVGAAHLNYFESGLGLDLTDTGSGVGILRFDVRFEHAGDDVSTSWRVRIGTGNGTDYRSFLLGTLVVQTALLNGVWYTISIDPSDLTNSDFDSGTPDFADINYLRVGFADSAGEVGDELHIDNIRVIRGANVVVQNNAVGGNDFSGVSEDYRVRIWPRGVEYAALAQVKIAISDEVGSGTTKPTAYREIIFPSVPIGSWTVAEESDVDNVGTIDDTDINTLRIEWIQTEPIGTSPEIQARIPEIPLSTTVWVDHLQVADTLLPAYDADAGTVMIHPADIMRHWIEVVGGERVDAASFAALITALGPDAEWGFDARGMGFSWEEVLQRMAFEARCNIASVETTSGRRWKVFSADANYGYGSTTKVITQTQNMTDIGRDFDELGSRFIFRYGFDASAGPGISADGYRSSLVANPAASQVPIAAADLAEAERRFGARDIPPFTFRAIQDEATAQDVAGFYVQELSSNDRRMFELEDVAWFDAMPYEVGEIVSITPPWDDTAITCRILSMSKEFHGNTWTLLCVEVLETGSRI
jgi:hypothetical protein